MFFSCRRPQRRAMCFNTLQAALQQQHWRTKHTHITFIFNPGSYITCKTRVSAGETAIKAQLGWKWAEISEVGLSRAFQRWNAGRFGANFLPELRVFPAPSQLFCSRSPSGAGRLKTAERRPPPGPCCPAGPTGPTGKPAQNWNIIEELFTVQFMLAIQRAAGSGDDAPLERHHGKCSFSTGSVDAEHRASSETVTQLRRSGRKKYSLMHELWPQLF